MTVTDGRRTLCAAQGILVALQQCSLDDALLDLIGTARRHNVAPLRLATALLTKAQGTPAPADDPLDAVVDVAWGPLLKAARLP
ncbi:ANTAR domain-containing protein [Mycobacterium sp. smrl_JER01]|uniref:ANTAR domain-containing protein n=1 Tax=Mycobacterium sp. smrl_JER01 TaxID=3402633 RepID=UPI003AD45B5B